MVIGPGNTEEWKLTGNASYDRTSAELHVVFSDNDVPVISGMPLHRRLEIDEFHFKAWPVDLEPFPAYLAATVELTIQIATLKDAISLPTNSNGTKKKNCTPCSRGTADSRNNHVITQRRN